MGTLKKQNSDLIEKMKLIQDENDRLKVDNVILNKIVHEYPDMMDDDSMSQKSSSMPSNIPLMHCSKSDQTDFEYGPTLDVIAPGLLRQHQSLQSLTDKRKEKFDKLTLMRNSGKMNNTSNRSTPNHSEHNNNNNSKRKKNKTFQRPKYHSFVAGQAKKNSNDPLLSVKNTLIH